MPQTQKALLPPPQGWAKPPLPSSNRPKNLQVVKTGVQRTPVPPELPLSEQIAAAKRRQAEFQKLLEAADFRMDQVDEVIVPTLNDHTAQLALLKANGETNRDNNVKLNGKVDVLSQNVAQANGEIAKWLSEHDDDSIRHDEGIRECQVRLAVLEAQHLRIRTTATIAQGWTAGQKALVATTILTLASAAIFLLRLL